MTAVAEWASHLTETGEECDSVVILRGDLEDFAWQRLGARVDALITEVDQ